MRRNVFKLIIVSSFGRNSQRPISSAVIKILAALVCSAAFGGFIAASLWQANLPTNLPVSLVAAIVAGSSLVFSALLQLSIGSSSNSMDGKIPLVLLSLPLRKYIRWFIKIVPVVTLNIFFLIFSLPIVAALTHAMQITYAYTILALLLGSLAGLGYIFVALNQKMLVKVLGLGFITLGQAKLLETLVHNPTRLNVVTTIMLAFDVLLCLGILGSLRQLQTPETRAYKNALSFPLLHKLINFDWFIVKTFRNKRTRLSFLFCLMISGLIAAILQLRHMLINTNDLFFVLALLSATFASDIRSISRKHKTPEIIVTKGLDFFINSEIISVVVASLIIGLPMYFLLVIQHGSAEITGLIIGIAMQFAAVLCGLLFSSLLVPQAGDVGTQFFASILAASIIFVLPKIIDSNETNLHQLSAWLLMGLIGWFIIYVIELQRRRSYGISAKY